MARSLLPREHGAYVQLLVPFVAAFAVAGASTAAILFAIGAWIAFALNEPLLVILGHRGRRSREQDGARARVRLVVLGPLAAIAGLTALVLASPEARACAAVVAVPSLVLVVLAWRRQERTLAGELVAVLALTGAALPSAVAAGMPVSSAVLLWLAWAAGYASTVIAVHRVIARGRRTADLVDRWIGISLSAVTLTVIALGTWGLGIALVALPLVACSTGLVLAPPPARRLRAIGFGLVVASAGSVAIAIGAA